MIKMLIYRGYQDDGVEGYECLNCYSFIQLRHHAFSQTLDYCPFCGCHFEGGYIKDNNYKVKTKDESGYYRYKLEYVNQKHYKQKWEVEKRHSIFWDKPYPNVCNEKDNWETIWQHDDYDRNLPEREQALRDLKYNMNREKEDNKHGHTFGQEVIEFRLKYYKYYFSVPYEEAEKDVKYYYPKDNKIIFTENTKRNKK